MSEDQLTLSRIARLEETQEKIFELLREVREYQIRTAERERLTACPQPGLCVRLQAQVDKIAALQEEHEEYVQQAKGMSTLTKWLWSIFGAAGLIGAIKVVFFSK